MGPTSKVRGGGPEGKGKLYGEGKRGRGMEGDVMAFFGGGSGRPEISSPRSFLKVVAYGFYNVCMFCALYKFMSYFDEMHIVCILHMYRINVIFFE